MLSAHKAEKMLHEGKAKGKKITDRQRRYFGAVSSGKSKNIASEAVKRATSPKKKMTQTEAILARG